MKKALRRRNSNSPESQVTTLLLASTSHDRLAWADIVPPSADPATRASEVAIMRAIMLSRAPQDWSDLDTIIATRAASLLASIMRDEAVLRGPSTRAYEGRRDPLLDSIATRSAICAQLFRQLGLSLPATDRRQLKAAGRVLEVMRVFDSDDDLIAKPVPPS